jgi:polyhydroxybutyrate depolymerase
MAARLPQCAASLLALLTWACRDAGAPVGPDDSARREAEEIVAAARRQVEAEEKQPPREPQHAQVFVPEQGPEGARPLLVFLHGLGGSGAELVHALDLRALAGKLGFAFIAPEGHLDYSGRRFWNASSSCCNFDALEVDHVAALSGWIDAALKHPRVDAGRVYLVGFSNGGFMAYRAACEIGSRLRGIFSIAGAGPSDLASCHPQQQLSVVQIHGDADAIVAFAGGHLFADSRRPRHPSAEASLRFFAELDGCSETPRVERDLDLDPRISGAETQVMAFPECRFGAVELWRIRGGDHASGLSRRSLRAIWEFIRIDGARVPPGERP